MNELILLKANMNIVDLVISFFLSKGSNKNIHSALVERVKELKQTSYRPWLDSGYFSKVDFLTWYLGNENVASLPENVLDMTLRLLCQQNLLYEKKWETESVFIDNTPLVEFFAEKNLIKNVLFGFSYSITHFEKSIFKIEHIDRKKDHLIGTGFYYAVRDQIGEVYSFIISNKHVVENAMQINVYDQYNNLVDFLEIIVSDTRDLAVFILEKELNVASFNFNEEPNVLDDIVTMGFPSVPMTRDSYLLCHKGEINAFVKDFEGVNHILISAKTSSGNSGGPIIDVTGRLVGIVTKEFYDENQLISKGKLPYYAGITSNDIREFFNEVVIPKVLSH